MLNLQVALDSSYWTWVNHTFIWGSIAVYFILQLALNYALVWIGADAPYVGSLTMVSSNMIFLDHPHIPFFLSGRVMIVAQF